MNELETLELRKAVTAINESIVSNKIYLFGSYSLGVSDKQSDLDLCILTNVTHERKVDILRRIRRTLARSVSIPIDLLLYSSNEFDERAHISSTLEYKILNEGILVYGS